MADQLSEKTELPTQRRLDEALKKGEFPRSAEVQTVFVLVAGMMALAFVGQETWGQLVHSFIGTLGHLHSIPITLDSMQTHGVTGALVAAKCVWPIVVAIMVAGLLAGGIQSRFQTASEAFSPKWERINPIAGFKRIFSIRAGVPALINVVKLVVVITLTYRLVLEVLEDPIFASTVSAARIGEFMAQTSFRIVMRVCLALAVIATVDYAWQWWRTNRDMMMTREEVKEESRNSEGNPQIKARRRRSQRHSQRKMLLEVPKADVIVTNPTHLAVALRYDRKTMKAPRVIAKGSRLNALRIREIARQHQVPILENKPVARMLFKYGRVGSEIPAQLFAAVAEILAWVYRVNRYRYYSAKMSNEA